MKKPPTAADQAGQGAQNLVSGTAQHSKQENARVVADVARKLGVDPVLAVADMLVESNGNNTEHTGDGGSSFGLFQLHEHGELPADWYRGKANHDRAFDPRANAEVALKVFAANKGKYSGASLAYHSQRPADQAGYERAVNAKMDEARSLLK
ncbi:MAG: transglycosylase SLT domain-containing protein [Thermoleophilia bacterium]|nr:transglycosylase SLT domain-containing protein [Thermoleophilia bacterium]